jgi:hypothetical protein
MEDLNIKDALTDFSHNLTMLSGIHCHDLIFNIIKLVEMDRKSKVFIQFDLKFLTLNINLINEKKSFRCFQQMKIYATSQLEKI